MSADPVITSVSDIAWCRVVIDVVYRHMPSPIVASPKYILFIIVFLLYLSPVVVYYLHCFYYCYEEYHY